MQMEIHEFELFSEVNRFVFYMCACVLYFFHSFHQAATFLYIV
jgi:hypothetical protein